MQKLRTLDEVTEGYFRFTAIPIARLDRCKLEF
jgi:hypothetical protein